MQHTLVHGRDDYRGIDVKRLRGEYLMSRKKENFIYTYTLLSIALFTASCFIWSIVYNNVIIDALTKFIWGI
jgi:hypothetical protein